MPVDPLGWFWLRAGPVVELAELEEPFSSTVQFDGIVSGAELTVAVRAVDTTVTFQPSPVPVLSLAPRVAGWLRLWSDPSRVAA